jgi:hypothetical protein
MNTYINSTNNYITENRTGMVLLADNPDSLLLLNVNNNAIANNIDYNASTDENNVNLLNNWWGTTDTVIIESKLYHKPQDFNLGIITYAPFLTSMPSDIPFVKVE